LRADLLALGDDTLAALANRGIVKRSAREVAEGKGPTVDEADDGTVTGTFGDGTTVVLAPGSTLERAACTCPASGVCRHRVMTVLAYQATGSAGRLERWSPAEFSDEAVETMLGARVLTAARKAFRTGYRARVRRPTVDDPVPTVELPSCTVRFLVPHELGYARVDAARGAREDAIALAVWAFRAADDADGDVAADTVDLAVGGERLARITGGGSGIEPALALAGELLADGVVHSGPAVTASIAAVRRALDGHNLRWPVDALDEIADQLDAYRARSARYHPESLAALLAELMARHRCVAGNGASLRPGVLGTEEAAETPLRLLRLTGLGARVWGDDASRSVEVYLAHAEAGLVLTLRRRVDVADGDPPSAAQLGRRKAGGARLSALAGGNVVTESAVRSANRVVRIAESRLARTTVAPSSGTWDALPTGILVDDLDAEAVRLAGLPPAIVRSRVVAEAVRAVVVDDVEDVRYLPGEQRLVAVVRAPTGRATVTMTHSAASAGAIDAMAEWLGGSLGPVRFVSGHLRRHAGDVVIDATAVVAGSTMMVPAFASVRGTEVPAATGAIADPLAAATAEAIAVSAEVPHRGWRHLPPGWAGRAERCSQQLRRVGLERAAQAVADLAAAGRSAPGNDALPRWADTHLRLLVTAEQL
jgi:hypothetical protein